MKKLYTLFIALFASLGLLYGQIDQVSYGTGYSEMAFYNLHTSEQQTIPLNSWDLAFSNLGRGDAAIFINEGAELMGTPLQLYLATDAKWDDDLSSRISEFSEETQIRNPDETWETGALNSIKDADDPLDFGWGYYDTNSHQVIGDRVFVIKNRNESWQKFEIASLASGTYTINVADLDGANEKTYSISKDESKGPKMFMSLEDGSNQDIQIAYDLIFTRYNVPLDDGEGGTLDYSVSGVLLAPGTSAVSIIGVDPLDVDESEYSGDYDHFLRIIGHEWKQFSFFEGWIVPENQSYLIKRSDGHKYQLTFYDFEGSSTGVATFEKKYLGQTVNTLEQTGSININVYPNPMTNYLQVSGHNSIGQLIWTDAMGRSTVQQVFFHGEGSAERIERPAGLASGAYTVQFMRNKETISSHRVIVR